MHCNFLPAFKYKHLSTMEAHTDIYMHIIKQPTLYPKLEVSNPTAALTRREKVTEM
jgi:hypothetical protein